MDAIRLLDSGFWLFAQETISPALTKPTVVEPAASGMSGWWLWLITLAIIAGSYFLASSLAKSWRMYDYTGRFFTVIFSTAVGIAILVTGWPPKLGIDLSGGQTLIYQLDQKILGKDKLDENDVLSVRSVVNRVLKSENIDKNPAVKLSDAADDRILIDIDGIPLNMVDRISTALTGPDVLPSGASLQKLDQTAKHLEFQLQRGLNKDVMGGLVSALTTRINPGGQKEYKIKPFGDTAVEILIPKAEPAEIAILKQKLSSAGTLEFRILANGRFRDHKRLIDLAEKTDADVVIDPVTASRLGKWVLVKNEEVSKLPADSITRPGRAGRVEVLVNYDDPDIPVVTGADLQRAGGDPDPERLGNFQVSFNLKGQGARDFGRLTRQYASMGDTLGTKAQLAIIIDKEIFTAPNLETAITGGSGRITGDFTEPQVKLMATVLNSGSLPAALNKVPIAEESISSQLGEDTIRSGSTAMIIATAAILVFMLWYYGFAGLVADLAVILNILLVVALMISLKAAFTLAGLAGLVLSVGMAVDANVLIFERMREEVHRGSALKMAIRNGFAKAMSTVVDSNLTTLISGVVLFAIGTEQLKGFATTLILGLLLNLFTAVYCSRILFDVAEKRGWITRLNMRSMLGETKFDFVRPVTACVTMSCILIAAGLGLAFMRGETFFDIDFTGGSTIQIVLKKDEPKMTIADVRSIVGDSDKLPDMEVSEVYNTGDTVNQKFKIVTSNLKLDETKEALSAAFGPKLERYTMTVANVGPYVPKVETPPTTTTPEVKLPEVKVPEIKEPATIDPAVKEPATDSKEPSKEATEPAKEPAAKSEAPAKEEPAKEPMTEAPATKEVEAAKDAAKESTQDATKDEPAKDAPATEDPAKEEANKQSHWLPNAQWLALAAMNPTGSLPLWQTGLLLQDEPKQEPTKDEPTKDEPTKDAEPAQGTEPAKEVEPATPTEPAKGIEPAITDLSNTLATSGGAPAKDTNYKSSAELTFSTEVSRQYLNDVTVALLEKNKGVMRDYDFRNAQNNVEESAAFKTWTMVSSLEPEQLQTFVEQMSAEISSQPVFSQVSNVGSEIAGGTQNNALWALIVSCLAIVLYVWFRFQNLVFGFAAVIALVHDVLITLGALALSAYLAPGLSSVGMGWLGMNPFKISLEVVAALLTIIGFSINDTIVIFDRIRELRGKSPDITKEMVNKAVNQTLGRTILTSGTVLIVTLILYFFGGEEIHPFSFAMLIGIITGTYSTIFIAAPLVLWFRKRQPKATTMSNYTGVKSMTSR